MISLTLKIAWKQSCVVMIKNKNKNKIFFDINADKYMSSMVSDEFAKDHRKITFAIYYLS
jgi:hypothetical protein